MKKYTTMYVRKWTYLDLKRLKKVKDFGKLEKNEKSNWP